MLLDFRSGLSVGVQIALGGTAEAMVVQLDAAVMHRLRFPHGVEMNGCSVFTQLIQVHCTLEPSRLKTDKNKQTLCQVHPLMQRTLISFKQSLMTVKACERLIPTLDRNILCMATCVIRRSELCVKWTLVS